MKAFSFSLRVLLFASLVEVGASFAAENPGLSHTQAGAGVTVKVTYLAQTARESRFSVVLDTHSVSLDTCDVKALSVLRDDTAADLARSQNSRLSGAAPWSERK